MLRMAMLRMAMLQMLHAFLYIFSSDCFRLDGCPDQTDVVDVADVLVQLRKTAPAKHRGNQSATVSLQILHEGQGEKDAVVLIRTFNPMPGMLERMRAFQDDLQVNAPKVQLALSIDTTTHDKTDQIRKAVPKALIHKYTWEDVKLRYPLLNDVSILVGENMPSPYNYHMEPVLLARHFIMESARIARNASYWVFEDDVFMCKGSLSQFIKHYDRVQSDVLLDGYHGMQHWSHTKEANWGFRKRFPVSSRWHSREHVVRFSQRFLDHVEEEVKAGLTAQSEMFASTECVNNAHKFKCAKFEREHIGVFDAFHKLATPAVEEVCRNSSGMTINHAAKY